MLVITMDYLLIYLFILFNYTDALGAVLANNLDKPRAYIGCMKSGEVFSQP